MGKNEIVLFESRDGAVTLPVPVRDESVWLYYKKKLKIRFL